MNCDRASGAQHLLLITAYSALMLPEVYLCANATSTLSQRVREKEEFCDDREGGDFRGAFNALKQSLQHGPDRDIREAGSRVAVLGGLTRIIAN